MESNAPQISITSSKGKRLTRPTKQVFININWSRRVGITPVDVDAVIEVFYTFWNDKTKSPEPQKLKADLELRSKASHISNINSQNDSMYGTRFEIKNPKTITTIGKKTMGVDKVASWMYCCLLVRLQILDESTVFEVTTPYYGRIEGLLRTREYTLLDNGYIFIFFLIYKEKHLVNEFEQIQTII